jgi:tRNA modification GTPase
MMSDTIVAPATPPGYGGISIVRISGSLSTKLTKQICKKSSSFSHRRPTLSSVYNGAGKIIDNAVFTFFKSPHSYTGEDVLEISCHGNPIIVDQIVSTICSFGARLADPGEFTKRAFLNGKLDLVQAESVSKLIESRSIEAANINSKILSGSLSKKLNTIKESVVGVLAELEFEFDISENESLIPNLVSKSHNTINNNILACEKLIASYADGRLFNRGARVVIYGNPNVGKSTLLNALLEKDRAITSDVPGTTRDTVDADIVLGGIPVTLIDTAGIRSASSGVESAGIKRSYDEIKNADLLINVVTSEGDVGEKVQIKNTLIVFNKIDLVAPPEKFTDIIPVSALLGDGIASLKNTIKERLISKNTSGSDVVLTTRRQEIAITGCKNSLKASLKYLNKDAPELEIVAFELRDSINYIDVLMGKTTVDDILNKVFSGFCVGK